MRKRILSVLLTIAMLMSVVSPTYVFAEEGDAISFRLEASEVDVNNEVTVKLYADKNDGVVGFQAIVSIDANTFEIDEDSEWYDMPTSLYKTSVNSVKLSPDKSVLSFIVANDKTISTTGELLWFKMKVKDTATSGEKAISFITTGDAVTKYVVIVDNEETGFEVASLTNTSVTISIPVTGITISGDDSITGIGNTTQLTVAAQPENANQPKADMSDVEWSTSNNKVATVENGRVIAAGEGTATITAAFEGQTATKDIKVAKAAITGEINVPATAEYMQTITAKYTGNAQDEDYTVTWYHDDGSIIYAPSDDLIKCDYPVKKDDIGHKIYVVVTSDNFTGEIKSSEITIEKATMGIAPETPVIEANENVITVTNVVTDAQYRLNNGEFGTNTSFTVEYGKSYYVEAYYPETATHKASDIVTSNTVTTPKAPCKLTVTSGEGGSVSVIPEGTVREDDKVTLTATPGDFDHKFVKWEVTGITLTEEAAKANPITFTMGSTDVEIKAVFKEKKAAPVDFGADKTFTYNGKEQAPAYSPDSYGNMSVKVEYFARGGNVALEGGKPTNVGKYTMQVTYAPNSADSEYKTTVATCDFEIVRANQDAPAAPVPTNATSNSFELDIVAEQEYVISTTQATPAESEWKKGTELISPVKGLDPATLYYVHTRKAGNNNYNPSPAVYATVTTAHTYEWELSNGSQIETVVRIGGYLPSPMAQIFNRGTGLLTEITATLGGTNNDKFELCSVGATAASGQLITVEVNLKDIDNKKEGIYTCTVTVKAKEIEEPLVINFKLSVAKKGVATFTGIDDTTVTFNGNAQEIDLSKAKVNCNGTTFAPNKSNLTVTYTKDNVTVTEPRDAGTYTATIKYEDADYIGSTTAQLIIEKKDVTLTGLKAFDRPYKGHAIADVDYSGATLEGKIEGTDVSVNLNGIVFEFEDKNVGENKTVANTTPITLTGADADNYNLTKPIVELKGTITPLPITVNVTVDDKTYNGRTDDAKVNMSATGIIAGDIVQFTNATGTYATADAGENVEVTVTNTISGADQGNYNFEIANKAYGKVNKAELNVTITAPAAVTYDGKTHEVSSVADDRVAADKSKTLYTLTYAGGDALPVDANTYEVTAKLTDDGSKNYILKANTVGLVINNADMTAANKEYSVAFMLAGAQNRSLSDLQLAPANVSGMWSVAAGTNEILDGEAKIDGENLVFTVKSGLTTADIGKKAELTLTFTPDKNYNPVTATVTVTLAQDTYTNSLVGTLPTQVKLGDALDFSGVQLVTKFGSGAPDQTLDVNDSTKVEVTNTYDPAAKEIGVKTVTFTDKANGGITYTHAFTVVDVLEGVKLAADRVEYTYKLKEATSIGFDGKVYAVYKSGAKKALTHADVVLTDVYNDGTVKNIDEARLLSTLGNTVVTLTYTENYFDGTSAAQSIEIDVGVLADPAKPDGKPTAEGFIIEPIPDEGKDMKYYDGNGNEVPAEEVEGRLTSAIEEPDADKLWDEVKNGGAFSNIDGDNIVYEQIDFSSSSGKREHVDYRNGKMQITVPYPADSDKNDEFVMVIQDNFGHTETIVPIKTANGLQFITDLSNFKFAIGWYTPAPTPVQPSEPAEDPQDSFWNEVYWALIRSGSGSVITANAGYYDKVPQGVLRAVDASGNTLIINSAFGVQVVVTPGALEKLGAYRFYYPISYLKEMLKGSTVISGSGSTGVTIGVLMPTTGDATVVDHPYSMTPATAGIIPGLESAANARPVIDNADGVSVLDGAQRNEGAVIGGGMLIGLGLLALLGAAYVTMRKRGN